MSEKRFVVTTDIDLEVNLKDNLEKDYPFSLVCENIDEFESLLNEVTNCSARMNRLWEQTQRFEDHNMRLLKENEQLKEENELLKKKLDCITASLQNELNNRGGF